MRPAGATSPASEGVALPENASAASRALNDLAANGAGEVFVSRVYGLWSRLAMLLNGLTDA